MYDLFKHNIFWYDEDDMGSDQCNLHVHLDNPKQMFTDKYFM